MIHAALKSSNRDGTHTRESNYRKVATDDSRSAQQRSNLAALPRMNSVRSGNSCE
jgi:hypothetical protein